MVGGVRHIVPIREKFDAEKHPYGGAHLRDAENINVKTQDAPKIQRWLIYGEENVQETIIIIIIIIIATIKGSSPVLIPYWNVY